MCVIAGQRSTGTFCVVSGFILQFSHFSGRAGDLSVGGISHGNTYLLTPASQQCTKSSREVRGLSGGTCGSVQFRLSRPAQMITIRLFM